MIQETFFRFEAAGREAEEVSRINFEPRKPRKNAIEDYKKWFEQYRIGTIHETECFFVFFLFFPIMVFHTEKSKQNFSCSRPGKIFPVLEQEKFFLF